MEEEEVMEEEEALRLDVEAIEWSSRSRSPLSPRPSLWLPVCICDVPGPRDDELAFVAASLRTLDTSECIWPVCVCGNGTFADRGVDPSLAAGDFLEVPAELGFVFVLGLEVGLEGIRGPMGVRMSGEPGILSVVEVEPVEIDEGLWV